MINGLVKWIADSLGDDMMNIGYNKSRNNLN